MSEKKDKELFYKAQDCVQEKYEKGILQKLINQGLDVNQKDEYDYSLAERAIFGAINYDALHTLWKANAIPESEYVKEIFGLFEKGKTPKEFYEEENKEKNNKLRKATDITKSFSAKKLQINNASFEITEEIINKQDSEIILTINLKPFIFEEHYTETEFQFVGFCNSEMRKNIFEINGYIFKEDEIESSSIYIQHSHNPVDLKKLTITENNEHFNVKAMLYFDFEYENTDFKNEKIVWEFKVEK